MRRLTTIKDQYSEARLFQSRIISSLLIVLCLLLVVVYRYTNLQIIHYEKYRTQSDRNRVYVQPLAPKRGLIYDRNGELLANNEPSYNLVIVKERTQNIDNTLEKLHAIFNINETELTKFHSRLKRRKPFQAVPLLFKLNEEAISLFYVNRHMLPGVNIKAQLVRHYPHEKYFSHVLGYVGRINAAEQQTLDETHYAGTDYVGKIGIEQHYENKLHGQVGSQHVETNARGRVLRVLEQIDAKPGADLTLNIDAQLQIDIHMQLKDRRGAVIALNPKNGAVLAMVSTPSFDPNAFVTGISGKDYNKLRNSIDLPLFNRALQGQYPPGSTIKPIYGLAGLHYNLTTPYSVVADPGWYRLANDERYYRDWKRGGHADFINLADSIIQSCDVYFYDLAIKLGIDRIHEYTQQFGLGEKTNIDSTNERSGLLPSREWKRNQKQLPWFPGETLNIGIGQGYMLATPMQLAVATATIANRGLRPTPRIVKRINKQVIKPQLIQSTNTSDAHWQTVIDAMEAVVHQQKGTANAISKGISYRMAGKTGTAQVIGIAQDEEYDEKAIAERQRDHALFIGFAPVDDPEVAVAVIVENGGSGSSAAAPIARFVMDQILARSHKQKNDLTPLSLQGIAYAE